MQLFQTVWLNTGFETCFLGSEADQPTGQPRRCSCPVGHRRFGRLQSASNRLLLHTLRDRKIARSTFGFENVFHAFRDRKIMFHSFGCFEKSCFNCSRGSFMPECTEHLPWQLRYFPSTLLQVLLQGVHMISMSWCAGRTIR